MLRITVLSFSRVSGENHTALNTEEDSELITALNTGEDSDLLGGQARIKLKCM